MARAISPWCSRAARNAATTVGSPAFRPLFIPGMTSANLRDAVSMKPISSLSRAAYNYEP